ncbi:uncharacterized protein [Leptinotarsa decemlineata]|uniref:uncharacterized protein n=1 Tax=Leptinotarsa decemlineata TaxID=7539 RepID=UPI000C2555BB|nr:uncharacterized protein LOC111512257 [Leptinotarsa decemlineata]
MEDNTTDIVLKQLTSHKCTFCGGWLSIPPVMTVSDDGSGGTGQQCGRCKHIKCRVATRNTIFENVAKHLQFSCIHENCQENIPWREVDSHEKRCPHRRFKCPVYYEDCEEHIEISHFKSHMQMMHKKNIYYEKIVVEMINTVSTQVCLLIVHSLQFLILFSEDQICATSLQSINNNFHYHLRFSSFVKPSISLSYENISINEYHERESCFKCLKKQCALRIHPYAKNITDDSDNRNKKHIINFNWKNVSSIVGNHILVTLKVTPTTNQELFPEELEAADNNEHIKKTLECPICTKYMTKEIYSCEIGHLLCNECKSKVTLCPSCQAPIGCARNYALESMAENVNIPCKNDNKGCVFVGKLHMLSRHEDNCSYNAQ